MIAPIRGYIFFSSPFIFFPNTSMFPEVIGVNPKIIFMIVVFPAPLRPNKP